MLGLRSAILAIVLTRAQCSYDLIAGYEPATDVTDHSHIDLDQAAIENYLSGNTAESFQNAQNVYQEGAFSKSVATLTLTSADGLTVSSSKGSSVTGGKNGAGGEVLLKAYNDLATDSNKVQVQYIGDDCNVGGLEADDQRTGGCLAENGTIVIGGTPFDYTYSVTEDNFNGRTIAGFSTGAEKRMRPASGSNAAYFPDFQKFYDYYGIPDYADEWVNAAFQARKTNFANGNADFTFYNNDYTGLAEAIKKGTAYMNVAMYVIRELEDAIDDCERGCKTADCNDDAVHALDEAVAFYTGSLKGTDGSGEGVLMYSLADKRAANFKTAGPNGDDISGKSKVNYDIFNQFSLMKANLVAKDCTKAYDNKERIAQLMFIPLIQGTLRYAFKTMTDPDAGTKAESEGAVFAAAVLPMVAACNSKDAAEIHQNVRVGQGGTANFPAVKKAFEKNYKCMGVTCADVGGLWNDGMQKYEKGAAPCGQGGASVSALSSSASSTTVNAVLVGLVAIAGLAM